MAMAHTWGNGDIVQALANQVIHKLKLYVAPPPLPLLLRALPDDVLSSLFFFMSLQSLMKVSRVMFASKKTSTTTDMIKTEGLKTPSLMRKVAGLTAGQTTQILSTSPGRAQRVFGPAKVGHAGAKHQSKEGETMMVSLPARCIVVKVKTFWRRIACSFLKQLG